MDPVRIQKEMAALMDMCPEDFPTATDLAEVTANAFDHDE